MALKDSSILGIDLHEQEIRVVQVRTRSNKAIIGKIGRSPMPEGAISGGRVLDISAVSIALRLLLNSMDVGTATRAVVGVLGDGVTLRNLTVPHVPDSELPTIIAGEVTHYGLVKSAGGTFAYMRLNPLPRVVADASARPLAIDKRETSLDPDSDDAFPTLVTVLAVEEDVINSLRDTLEQANLSVEAVEPVQYGMLRAVMSAASPSATLFALLVGPMNCDVAFVFEGNLVGYRRIDIGSQYLMQQDGGQADSATPTVAKHNRNSLVDEFGHQIVPELEGQLNPSAVNSLTTEVQRTLDYYQRQLAADTSLEQVFLVVDDIRVAQLAQELTTSLGLTVEIVRPATAPSEAGDAASEADAALGPIYSGAFGLAMQGSVMSRVPRIDLFSKQRAGVQQAEIKRNFKGSIATSVVAIALGIFGYLLYQRQIGLQVDETDKANARIAQIQTETGSSMAQLEAQDQQALALRNEGIPLSVLIDYVTASFGPDAGLTSLTVNNDLVLTIAGEATTESTMDDTLKTLKNCPVITDLQLSSSKQLLPEEGNGIGFEFGGKTISRGRILEPEANQ